MDAERTSPPAPDAPAAPALEYARREPRQPRQPLSLDLDRAIGFIASAVGLLFSGLFLVATIGWFERFSAARNSRIRSEALWVSGQFFCCFLLTAGPSLWFCVVGYRRLRPAADRGPRG